jgi:ubiquinone biosynthesis protein
VRATKHLDRYRQISLILIDEGFDNALDWTGLRRFAPVSSRINPHRPKPESVPQRLRHTIERLGPTFVKIGQVASTRGDIIPEDIVDELRKLQDEVAPFPWEEAKAVVESELGGPIEQFYETFQSETMAAASLGQVYEATLLDGTPVVVKVQRPGVRKTVETDLDILLTQARFVAGTAEFGGRYDVVEIVTEFANAIRAELDYIAEATNAEHFRTMFSDDDTVSFPEVFWDLTTNKVLTLERIEGIPFNRPDLIEEAGMDRPELAQRGVYCYLEQIFTYGFFHADPHPGNLFAMPDGRVGFTDFGRVGTISQVGRDQLADLFLAIVDNDVTLASDVLFTAAGSPGDIDVPELERALSRLITKYYNRALGDVKIGELVSEVFALVNDHHLVLSSELALLLATLSVLEGLGTLLDPAFDFVEVTTPIARRIANERLEPEHMARTAMQALRRAGRLALDLPESLMRLIRRVGQGEIRMAVHPVGFEPALKRFEESVNRMAFALVVSAFVIGLSMMLAQTEMPPAFVWVARFAWAGAVVVGSWFFISILIARYRKPK